MSKQLEDFMTVDDLAGIWLILRALEGRQLPHPDCDRSIRRFNALYEQASEQQSQLKKIAKDKRKTPLLRFRLVGEATK